MSRPFHIALAGLGTVGLGVVKILEDQKDLIAARTGRSIQIQSIIAGNKSKDRGMDLSPYHWAESLSEMAQSPDIDAVVEVIGGADGATKDFVETALKNGKHVVTANKALMARHGVDLAKLAEKNQMTIGFEASVAGGIPVIKTLREGLAGNSIRSVCGILNGTCNYILTAMRERGQDYATCLAESQKKGYAEADPTFDVEGTDTGHKLCLLGALAFGVVPDFKNLSMTGIPDITAQDIQYAADFGYKIKLLGMAQCDGAGHYYQDVSPCLVPKAGQMGAVEDVFNAVHLQAESAGAITLTGRGAGAAPTASAVVADLIDCARGHHRPVFGVPTEQLKTVSWQDMSAAEAPFYARLHVRDEAGVLADITAELRRHDVSIDALVQRDHPTEGSASIALLTHKVKKAKMTQALEEIGKLPCVLDRPCLLRVERGL